MLIMTLEDLQQQGYHFCLLAGLIATISRLLLVWLLYCFCSVLVLGVFLYMGSIHYRTFTALQNYCCLYASRSPWSSRLVPVEGQRANNVNSKELLSLSSENSETSLPVVCLLARPPSIKGRSSHCPRPRSA